MTRHAYAKRINDAVNDLACVMGSHLDPIWLEVFELRWLFHGVLYITACLLWQQTIKAYSVFYDYLPFDESLQRPFDFFQVKPVELLSLTGGSDEPTSSTLLEVLDDKALVLSESHGYP
jgi:hypothetical protein